MGNVRKELEKTKQEYGKMFEEQKLLHDKAMEQVRSELEKAKRSIDHLSKTKKLSKSDVHAELVRVQEEKVVSNWGERSEPLPSQLNVNSVCSYIYIYLSIYVMDRLDISF